MECLLAARLTLGTHFVTRRLGIMQKRAPTDIYMP